MNMRRSDMVIRLVSFILINAAPQENFPEAEISNRIITTHLYLPDINTGYFRTTRFDWSGKTTSLEYQRTDLLWTMV